LSRDIALPRFARRLLRERHRALTEEGGAVVRDGNVAYFHGCAANYFNDGVGDAVIRILRRLGVPVVLPAQRCSGTPIETYGHLPLVRRYARENLASLGRFQTIVTGCASCTFALKDYARHIDEPPLQQQARELAGRVRHISEYLIDHQARVGRLPLAASPAGGRTVTYHSSCHLRAAGAGAAPPALLRQLPGVDYREMADADRCAGGAGTFLVKHAAQSQQIFARKAAAIEQSGASVVATSCPACMMQLSTGLKGKAEVKHIAQLIDEALQD
jgi:Fe-S oxidoreductase